MDKIKQAQRYVEEAHRDLEKGIKPSAEFGSELVRLMYAIRKLRDASIKQEFKEGVPGRVLVPKYGLSPTRISQITKHIWPKKQ